MRLVIAKDYDDMSKKAARLIADEVARHPSVVLGLATGGTPVGMYRELVALNQKEGIDFSRATSFNLDEYVGLSGQHPQSYRAYMQENLFAHINLPADRANIPRGDAADLAEECRRYEQAIAAAGGIDVQVLGIGNNGHIGFNEPGSARDTATRVVRLADSTIEANARYFPTIAEVPTHAVSMGIQTILGAKKIILLASGKAKAVALQRMLEGEMTEDVPASLLQQHPDVTVIADEEAASLLSGKTRG
ncbi:glucosamine-6-phosphate deaminase [Brevibacillus sp. GCM10020057]|uniref:glucosamine-6-phosphate deaminase n=1 Tax=Brevibacillus sp. GCM10020057 TaxID=3317327 RepID=UPI00362F8486